MIVLPKVFSSGAVFLQNSEMDLRGKGNKKSTICIQLKKDGKVIRDNRTMSDEDGNFHITLPTPGASIEAYTVTISDGEEFVMENVLFGEVWLASGQSNMELYNTYLYDKREMWERVRTLPIRFFRQDSFNYDIAKAKTVPQTPTYRDMDGNWTSVDSFDDFCYVSACATSFAKSIAEHFSADVPVAILSSFVGGTSIESWISPEDTVGEIYDYLKARGRIVSAEEWNQSNDFLQILNQTNYLFNSKTSSLQGYKCRGVIWYQGENNVCDREGGIFYMRCLEALRTRLQRMLGDKNAKNFPIICSQLFSWLYENSQGNNFGYLNEAFYRMTLADADNYSVVTNYDLPFTWAVANNHPIHPNNKYPIGERMAACAKALVYGCEGPKSAPLAMSYAALGNTFRVAFNNVGKGLHFQGRPAGFYIAGENQVYYPATAEILDDNTVAIWSESVSAPTAVAYQFAGMDSFGSLWGDMPVYPFSSEQKENVLYYPKPWLDFGIRDIWVHHFINEKTYAFYYPTYRPMEGSCICGDSAFTLTGNAMRVFAEEEGEEAGIILPGYRGYELDLYRYREWRFCVFNSEKAIITAVFYFEQETVTLSVDPVEQISEIWQEYAIHTALLPHRIANKIELRITFAPDALYHTVIIDRMRLL